MSNVTRLTYVYGYKPKITFECNFSRLQLMYVGYAYEDTVRHFFHLARHEIVCLIIPLVLTPGKFNLYCLCKCKYTHSECLSGEKNDLEMIEINFTEKTFIDLLVPNPNKGCHTPNRS